MLQIHSSTSVNQGIWKWCALRWSRNFEMDEWMKKTFWASNFALKPKFFSDALMWMPQLSPFSHILPHRNGALWRARFGLVQTCLYTVLCQIPESMQCSFKVFFFFTRLIIRLGESVNLFYPRSQDISWHWLQNIHLINLTLYVLNYSGGNIIIYLHIFVSFLHIDTTQVVEILPQIRQEPTYFT